MVNIALALSTKTPSSPPRSKKQERAQLHQLATSIFYRSLSADKIEIQWVFAPEHLEQAKLLSHNLHTHKRIYSLTYAASAPNLPVLTAIGKAKLQPSLEKWLQDHPSQKSSTLLTPPQLTLQTRDTWMMPTPLHAAVQQGNLPALEKLLSAGASPDVQDSRGNTPLHLAAQLGHEKMVYLLLAAKAPLNALNLDKQTPFHLACLRGHASLVQGLWEKGADPFLSSSTGPQGIHYAAHQGHLLVVRTLLQLATHAQRARLLQATDADGKTALHYASFQPQPELILLLLEKGASVSSLTHFDYTPLHLAARSGHLGIVKALLSQGALSSPNTNGDRPVHIAHQFGHPSVVHYLLQQERRSLLKTWPLPSALQPLLTEADQAFSTAKTPEELEKSAELYKQAFQATDKALHKDILSSCALQLSEIELQKSLASKKKQPEAYPLAAQYASTAEVLYRQAHALKPDAPLPLFLAQHQRLQIRFIRDMLEVQDTFYRPPALHTRALRQQLHANRQQLREEIQKPHIPTEALLQRLTQGFIDTFQNILKPCLATLGKVPCSYAFLGLGSMGRGEMSPYSDLEFALLLEHDSPEIRTYFRHLTQLLELQVIALNETPSPLSYIPGVDTPLGFSFDKGGNTPLGTQDLFELIGTPAQLVQFQTPEKSEGVFLIASNALKTGCYLAGDIRLIEAYDTALRDVLDGKNSLSSPSKTLKSPLQLLRWKKKNPSPTPLTPRQQQALQLLQGDLSEYAPRFQRKQEQTLFFNIKTELYRLPSTIVQELSLFYGIPDKGTWGRLRALHQNHHLSDAGLQQLTHLFNTVLRYRMQAHLFYEKEHEALYHPQVLSDPAPSSEKRFQLTTSELDQLAELHKVILPLQRTAQAFYASQGKEESFNLEKTFYDDSLVAQAKVWKQKLQYKEAQACYKKALVLNPHDIDALNQLGALKEKLGETEGQISLLEKAIEVAQQLHGKEHPEVAQGYNNLGRAYWLAGKNKQAVEWCEKALSIGLNVYGADHPEVAAAYNNLGNAHESLGESKRALEAHEKALSIRLKVFGPEHPSVATSYNNLGVAYEALGEYTRALEAHEKSLFIKLKVYGPEHPDVAFSYNNLGVAYEALGEYTRALEFYEKDLSISLQVYGPEHPAVAQSYNNLGNAYASLGEYKRALEFYEKDLSISLQVYSPEHPAVASSYNSLGEAYRGQGKLQQAVEAHQKALTILLKAFSSSHPDVAISYNGLGSAYKDAANFMQAIETHQKALQIRLKTLGPEHPMTAVSYNSLGEAYRGQGELQQAIEAHQKALTILLKAYSSSHPDMAVSYSGLGSAYQDAGNGKQALESYEKALSIWLTVYGPQHPRVLTCYRNLAATSTNVGDTDKAKEYTQKARALSDNNNV